MLIFQVHYLFFSPYFTNEPDLWKKTLQIHFLRYVNLTKFLFIFFVSLCIVWDFEISFCKIYICSAYAICAYLKTYSQLVPRLVTVALLFGKINKHFKSDSYDLLKTCLLESNLKKIPSSSRNELSNYICAAIIRYATALWLWVGNHSYIT